VKAPASLISILVAFSVLACAKGESLTGAFLSNGGGSSSTADYSNYIVVANNFTKSVVLLDPNGAWVRDLWVGVNTSADVPTGVAMYDDSTIMITIDGVDRVITVPLEGGSPTTLISDANLTATPLRQLTRLLNGDILVLESNTNAVERFTSSGTRVSVGWPITPQTGPTGVSALSNGGFILCSITADVVRAYNNAGTQTATVASGIAGTTDAYDCKVGPSQQVGAVWNGTTDTVRVYSSATLGATNFSYSDLSILSNPRALAFRPDGSVLAIDFTNNLMVEISSFGTLLGTYSNSVIANANAILVVP
jgi:hypothetical protein